MNNLDKKTFLQIGKLIIAKQPTKIWTVLGSCVAVIIYSKHKKIGAMCHAQLPVRDWHGEPCSANCPNACHVKVAADNDLRFVSCAVNYMVKKLNSMGIKNSELHTAIIGGSNAFNIFNDGKSVGQKNAEKAIQMLKDYRLRIIKIDTGGRRGRKVTFNSSTGEIKVVLHAENNKFDVLKLKELNTNY